MEKKGSDQPVKYSFRTLILLFICNYSVHLKKMQDAFVGTPFMASAGCPFAGNGRHKWRPYGVFPSYFRQD